MVFVLVEGSPIKEDLIAGTLVCGGDGDPKVDVSIGIGFPLLVREGDGALLME